jgi:hypothetical protein
VKALNVVEVVASPGQSEDGAQSISAVTIFYPATDQEVRWPVG